MASRIHVYVYSEKYLGKATTTGHESLFTSFLGQMGVFFFFFSVRSCLEEFSKVYCSSKVL
jgi:hypothetical protein